MNKVRNSVVCAAECEVGDRGWQKVRPGRKRGQERCWVCESEAFGLTRVQPNNVLLIKYSVCDDFIP